MMDERRPPGRAWALVMVTVALAAAIWALTHSRALSASDLTPWSPPGILGFWPIALVL